MLKTTVLIKRKLTNVVSCPTAQNSVVKSNIEDIVKCGWFVQKKKVSHVQLYGSKTTEIITYTLRSDDLKENCFLSGDSINNEPKCCNCKMI